MLDHRLTHLKRWYMGLYIYTADLCDFFTAVDKCTKVYASLLLTAMFLVLDKCFVTYILGYIHHFSELQN
jgi:hypothetical protein